MEALRLILAFLAEHPGVVIGTILAIGVSISFTRDSAMRQRCPDCDGDPARCDRGGEV